MEDAAVVCEGASQPASVCGHRRRGSRGGDRPRLALSRLARQS